MTMGSNKSRKPMVPLKSKLKKDPGIPRLPDLKVRNAEKQRAQHRPVHRNDPDTPMASEPTLSSLALLATTSQTPDDSPEPSTSYAGNQPLKTKEQVRKHYIRTLHKVIDQSDIIILVLDARDPEGCRSRLVEEEVRRRESEGKKLVFVLNKIDLVPRENAQLWLRHLRHSTPTLPFRSASSKQRSNLSSSTAPSLIRLLKAYKPSAQSVTVGVVGFPNVGKSSLINSLKRSKACAVAAQPGHTKDLQSVQLERGIRIVDSPGVVFDEDDEIDGKGKGKSSVLLRNVVRSEDVDDPIAVVEEILARTEHETLQKIYNLPQFTATLEFLTMLALNSGRLLKGGTPDVISAARQVLTDWNQQKIPYFSTPPSVHPSLVPSTSAGVVVPGAENVGQAQIVSTLGKPFELEGLFGAADAGAFGGPADQDMIDGEQDVADDVELMDEDGIQMESDDLAPRIPRKRSLSPTPSTVQQPSIPEPTARAPKRQRRAKDVPAYDAPIEAHALARSNPLNRKLLKKDAKRARRAATRAHNARVGPDERGMEIDDGASLEFTFMADTRGVL